MQNAKFSEYYESVVAKHLTAVDAEPNRSHQHEFGGLVKAGFAAYLRDPGLESIGYDARFYYFNDEADDAALNDGTVSWYDARRNVAHRGPELRLYYPTNSVTERISEGDLMLIAKRPDDAIDLIFAPAESEISRALLFLFGIDEVSNRRFDFRAFTKDQQIDEVRSAILQVLDLSWTNAASIPDFEDLVTARFGTTFPTTREFSIFARETAGELDPVANPDRVLLKWMQQEESLFRALENVVVSEKLGEGFEDVDDFISFSLSVQNRRKSRAGLALENHLEEVFCQLGVEFDRGVMTENKAKPDFLFPGIDAYGDKTFDDSRLDMLGVKTTCKDRWRQVLTEAEKISNKYLLTLEAGISEQQVAEMEANLLQLVVPEPLHVTYSEAVRPRLLTLSQFVDHLMRQFSAGGDI